MKCLFLLFSVLLSSTLSTLYGITEVWEAVVPENYTYAFAGESGSCLVIDQQNYDLLWYNSSGSLIKSFTVSDLINDNQNPWNLNVIFPFRLTESFCAIAIADYSQSNGGTPTYNLIGEFKNTRVVYGYNSNFVSARSYDYLAVIDNSDNELEVYKLGLDESYSTVSTIPSNAVVIPSDSSGPVQIILESSEDMVNWNSANPGTYGASTNERFFRIRAVEDTE